MVRPLDVRRLAAAAALIPFAALFAVACGGSDFSDLPDASTPDEDGRAPDATTHDGAASDAHSDAPLHDSGRDGGVSASDANGDADAAMPEVDADMVDGGFDAAMTADADDGAMPVDAGDIDAEDSALPHDAGIDAQDAGVPNDAGLSIDAALLDAALLDAALLDAALDAPSLFDGNFADSGSGPAMPSLMSADPFVVLGSATVTNSDITGMPATTLFGDLGTTGASLVGFGGSSVNQPSGMTFVNDAVATQALLDVGTAYTDLAGLACPPANALTGQDLGGMTLPPGVYCFTSSAGQIAGTTLTFDARNDPNAVWVIQVKTELTVLDNAKAVIINGPPAMACRIWWALGTAATLDTGTQYLGNFLASSSVSMLTAATLNPGRAFGMTGGVTLLSNNIDKRACP